MTITSPAVIVAAGVVCWHQAEGEPLRVLLVRRDRRDDFSLPKGKLDAGESLPEAAVRETLEETGLAVTLGAPLGTTEYRIPAGRDKIVHYWTAELDAAAIAATRFAPSAEVTAAEWMTVEEARGKLSYERDREVLDRFAERAAANTLRTFAIVALRHGKAQPAGSWHGPDASRPLEPLGFTQSLLAAKVIATYAPTKLVSSTAVRCMSTIEPLASLTGLKVKSTDDISQDAYEDGEARVAKIVSKRLARRETAVLCSHGPVLPEIVHQIASATGTPYDESLRQASSLSTGDFAVLHLSRDNLAAPIVAVEIHSPTR